MIDRWQVDLTLLEVRTLGAGGGSIARVNAILGNRLEVGPRSAGAVPGPACYDHGGVEPTVTDANLILGYVSPDDFHGGKMKLNREKAFTAIKERIAKPLQVEVEEAAWLIKKVVDGNMGDAIYKETVLRGYSPKDFVLFAYGGAGPTHCCGYASRVGVPKIVVFPYAPAFCAFGAAFMDIVMVYEQSKHLVFMTPGKCVFFSDYEEFNGTVRQLEERAIRDLEGQGYLRESAIFSLELDMRYGGQLSVKRIVSPRLFVGDEADAKAIYDEFEKEYAEAYSSMAVFPQGGVELETMALRVSVPVRKVAIDRYPLKGAKVSKEALKGKREAFWPELGGFKPTNIYEQKLLQAGNEIEGPAIIEADNTTVVLPPGKRYVVNQYLLGEID